MTPHASSALGRIAEMVYIAGHRRLVGCAIWRHLGLRGTAWDGATRNQPLSSCGTLNGISVERTSLDVAVYAFIQAVSKDAPAQAYRLVNSYTFALADTDPAYRALLMQSGINLPDGKPLVMALNRIEPGRMAFGQVRGPSFFAKCLDEGREHNVRHFLLGGSVEALTLLNDVIGQRFPGTEIVGMISPPFGRQTASERAQQDSVIKASSAQVVWVGLGTPKQDFEAQRVCDDCGITTAAVGAAFDFVAGTKPEAPNWMRGLSLEWVFRFLTEPRRLWRRYLFGNTRFIMLVLREALGRR